MPISVTAISAGSHQALAAGPAVVVTGGKPNVCCRRSLLIAASGTVDPEFSNQKSEPVVVPTKTNQSITPDALPIVAELNRFVSRPDVLAELKRAKADAQKQLQQNPDLSVVFVALDPQQFWSTPPDVVGSIRVVVTREGDGGEVERHPNSTQYLFALDGPVETHVRTADGWRVDRYGLGDSADLEDRWHVVPPDTWHKSVAAGARNWAVVAFHSARKVTDEYQQAKQ